ncbi:aspartyl/asparaginyl beta-hydroxylase domain-containing protein [Burkholderia orbicola]|uniref:aspartyl/asparaginyl beta-hydroxylase domain-containing protein n=1 Tax=Burkholderia orbicola TaxID=2978683 RepID=UPI00264C06C5|nr:aspartyl/asparaginyl beta-hydroxylase domain-containing protein [Burkholderia orbicola]MDN7558225.1 aspartyl/asparaginyl beta-hydroxylase domain-containing protein [Burkholderia orbicola]
MKHWHLMASGVDTMPLVAAIARQPELWSADTYLRHYPQGPFGDTDSIMLRFPKQVKLKSERQLERYKANRLPGHDQHESVFYPPWFSLPEAHQHVFALMSVVRGVRLGRVMINRVRPGGRIFAHRDSPEHTARWRRHHLVLHGKPGAMLRVADETIPMLSGMLFWFDNREEHEVVNNSDDDRISMVIDVQTCEVNV